MDLLAQPDALERKQFDAIKARAAKGDASAQFDLSGLYTSGKGVARDERKAAKWCRKAADQGLAPAQLALARDYADGTGVKPDPAQAFTWFRRAADQNLAEAQFEVGQCYAKGEGVDQDPVEAIHWYRQAANQDFVPAIGELGQCFFDGTGVATDVPEGLKWTRRAAEMGYAPAQNRLGLCYLSGEGLPQDLVQAYKWFNLGAAQGGLLGPDIKLNLAKAQSKMTPEQIAQAQQASSEFRPQASSGQGPSPATVNNDATSRNGDLEKTRGGLLTVTATDVSYEVYADGSFVGNPPAKMRLPEGPHLIEVKKTGFRDYRREIKISNGSELTLHVVLANQ